MPGLQQECSWQISWTDGPVHNSRALASGNNLKYIVKEGLGEGGEKNLFSAFPVPQRIFICVCQEQASLHRFLVCAGLRSSAGQESWEELRPGETPRQIKSGLLSH